MSEQRPLTRRSFLHQSVAISAAAFAAPYAGRRSPSVAAAGSKANNQIRIGGIGVGRRGGTLVDLFRQFDAANVVGIADVDTKRAGKVASWVDGDVYQDYRKLLDRNDVDAIVTATPDHWRALVTIHACQAGKHVYAEKPMTWTVAEGRKMVDAARKHDVVWQTGSQQRSNPTNRRGCELVRNGRIGKVKKVIASNYESPWIYGMAGKPVPGHIDWERWCGPSEVVPYHPQLETSRGKPGWLSFRRFAGGEMTGWGAHGFDQVQWALGMDDSGPVEIWTEGEPFHPPVYVKPESRARGNKRTRKPKVFMRYPGDIVMELGRGPDGGAIFVGEKGTITIGRGSLKADPPELAEEPLEAPDVQLYESNNHGDNWLQSIREGKRPVADVEIGHRSATVCHLGNIARWTGRKLKWDPDSETFVGDDEANYCLDRPRRSPYQLPTKV